MVTDNYVEKTTLILRTCTHVSQTHPMYLISVKYSDNTYYLKFLSTFSTYNQNPIVTTVDLIYNFEMR